MNLQCQRKTVSSHVNCRKKASVSKLVYYRIRTNAETMILKKYPETRRLTLHASSTIDPDNLTIDPLAILRRKEANDAGDINGKTNAVER